MPSTESLRAMRAPRPLTTALGALLLAAAAGNAQAALKCTPACESPAKVEEARAAIEAACPCAQATSKKAYNRCAKPILKERKSALGKRCLKVVKGGLKNSTCGRPGTVACNKRNKKDTKTTCKVVPAAKCKGSACVAFTSCLDACNSAAEACATTTTTSSSTTTTPTTSTTTTTAPVTKRVFCTSSKHAGNLGGLAGADAICQNLASTAGLTGTYLAWLSDSTQSPSTRFVQASTAYVRTDGATVADDWADLTDGTLQNPINLDENAATVSGIVWTNTDPDGSSTSPSDHCMDWSSNDPMAPNGRIGQSGDTGTTWTAWGTLNCVNVASLYCVEQ